MHVRQRFAHLVYVFSGFFFAKPATLSQTVKQLTLRRPLEDEVDLFVVVEETIHLQYVLVVEMALDFNLPTLGPLKKMKKLGLKRWPASRSLFLRRLRFSFSSSTIEVRWRSD